MATLTGLPGLRAGQRALVWGAGGAIGNAFVQQFANDPQVARVFAVSRAARPAPAGKIHALAGDLTAEADVAAAAGAVADAGGDLDVVLVASGLLHDAAAGIAPEKSWRALDAAAMARVFAVNTHGPSLIAKHFLPLLARDRRVIFAALSARVGSISDNRAGGWHAYRASKAALNMMIKGLAIELARRNPAALCVGLHPGTVDSPLSAPFQRNVPAAGLFTPARAAAAMLGVLEGLPATASGRLFAWDGAEIAP